MSLYSLYFNHHRQQYSTSKWGFGAKSSVCKVSFQHEMCVRMFTDYGWEDLETQVVCSFDSSSLPPLCWLHTHQTIRHPAFLAAYWLRMPMQRLTVIESYLDGGTFNEVVCGHGSPRAGSDGSRTRGKQWGMEHKICGKNLVGGLTNSCDYLTRWNNSGKSSASITATQPVCQISAVVKQVTKSTRQQAISLCSSTEKYKCIMIAGSDNSHVWTSVCIRKRSTRIPAESDTGRSK